ncbi:ATP-binding protein [Streptomyces sp. YU58]|uniref:ATP-binding protein n=1 Tax=Streptomyces sp. SX92 TaxID=3158972 RepID=UPI0027B8DC1B|nr:hypothetical protein [Streptomyces coralus]WLW57522.1 hypothetical protein QU709_41880 [Streptomyces coralus]
MVTRRQRAAGNLPAETTGLVGRRDELAQVRRLLGRSRLVTLTGVGGVGKTRLALRAAQAEQLSFRDGAWWLALSSVASGSQVLPYVLAEALPLTDQTARPVLDVVAEYLAGREALLVLDTCEHLVEDCQELVATLLTAAPGLRVLATSRSTLGMPREEVLTLEPLPVPESDDDDTADALVLLAERAAKAVPGFTLSVSDLVEAARLCRRLEGLPLALELAAARLGELSLAELNQRLDDRYAVLGNTEYLDYEAEPPWHQALRTAIGWSHQLCTPAERLLWARLSVFAGSFDAETARQVCADEHLPAEQIPRLLGTLAEKSILIWQPAGNGDRHRMLDTIREYGAHWLRGLGEEDARRRRHRDHYLTLARRGDAAWIGPDQFAWYDRMTAEHDNLRAALDYSLTEREPEPESEPAGQGHAALELAAALWFFWYACGFLKEGRLYLDRALAADTAPSRARAKALYACGTLLLLLGDLPALEKCAAECTALAAHFGDTERQYATATDLRVAALRGDPVQTVSLAEALLVTDWREKPLTFLPLAALVIGAHAHVTTGHPEEAITWLNELSSVCARDGERFMRAWGDTVHAMAELVRGRYRAAQEHARAALLVNHRLRDDVGTGLALESLAQSVTATGRHTEAAWLLGLTSQLWETLGRAQAGVPSRVTARQACEQQTRTALGDRAYETAYRAGHTVDLDSGIARALNPTPTPAPPP